VADVVLNPGEANPNDVRLRLPTSLSLTGAAALTGAGTLTAAGTRTVLGAAALTGTGHSRRQALIQPLGLLLSRGTVRFPATAPGHGSAPRRSPARGRSLLLVATPPSRLPLSPARVLKRSPVSEPVSAPPALTGAGTLSASGVQTASGSAALTGAGSLTAAGVSCPSRRIRAHRHRVACGDRRSCCVWFCGSCRQRCAHIERHQGQVRPVRRHRRRHAHRCWCPYAVWRSGAHRFWLECGRWYGRPLRCFRRDGRRFAHRVWFGSVPRSARLRRHLQSRTGQGCPGEGRRCLPACHVALRCHIEGWSCEARAGEGLETFARRHAQPAPTTSRPQPFIIGRPVHAKPQPRRKVRRTRLKRQVMQPIAVLQGRPNLFGMTSLSQQQSLLFMQPTRDRRRNPANQRAGNCRHLNVPSRSARLPRSTPRSIPSANRSRTMTFTRSGFDQHPAARGGHVYGQNVIVSVARLHRPSLHAHPGTRGTHSQPSFGQAVVSAPFDPPRRTFSGT
jgi:hypothetical protein